MHIYLDKPHLWKADVNASVDLFNQWFMLFAPKAYRDSRAAATVQVEEGIRLTNDLTALTPTVLRQHPGVLQVLRMATYPPLARDRLIGLAYASKNLVEQNLTVDPSHACSLRAGAALFPCPTLAAGCIDHSGCNDLRQSLSCGMLVAAV